MDCGTLITADDLYAFNPNFALSSSDGSDVGRFGADVLSNKGITCTYTNLSGGGKIFLTATKFDSASRSQVISELEKSSQEVDEGTGGANVTFFKTESGTGVAQVVHGDFLITAESQFFGSYLDAGDFLNIALAKL